MRSVSVRAASKLNLTLNITGKKDNLHTLDMLCCCVDLYEHITLTKSDDITLSCDNKNVPTDKKNTAFRAAIEFFNYTGLDDGVDIRIEKAVPIGAGMGGGSADAAGVLVGMNELFETNLTTEQLCDIGIKVGSDVPMCIIGGLTRVSGVGDTVASLGTLPNYYFVVAMAGSGMSTAEAYRRFDEIGTPVPANTQEAIDSLGSTEFFDTLRNDFEHSTTIDIEPVKQKMLNHGALTALMTGSGAAVFGVFTRSDDAQSAQESFGGSAWIVRPVKNGVDILP